MKVEEHARNNCPVLLLLGFAVGWIGVMGIGGGYFLSRGGVRSPWVLRKHRHCGVDVGQRELYASTFRQEGSNVSCFSVHLVAELGTSAFIMRAFHEVVDRSFES